MSKIVISGNNTFNGEVYIGDYITVNNKETINLELLKKELQSLKEKACKYNNEELNAKLEQLEIEMNKKNDSGIKNVLRSISAIIKELAINIFGGVIANQL